MTIDHLTPNRFDIPAKTLYARLRNFETDWGEEVYSHHLKVWNGYHEREPKKSSFEEYRETFDQILDDVENKNFDWSRSPIAVNGETGDLLNGGHRFAAALTFDQEIETEPRSRAPHIWNSEFFLNKTDIEPTGLLPEVADAMAIEYCRLRESKRDLHIVLIFPSAKGREEEVQSIIKKHGTIVYRKEAQFTENGSIHLTYQIYQEEPWVGSVQNRLKGARNKASKCFDGDGPVRAYLVQTNLEEMFAAKQEIRDLFQISNHSVHINDTYEETLHTAQLLFNDNSINFLNMATLRPSFKKFWALVEQARKAEGVGGICVGGSAAMAAYGIRDTGDLDYLHYRNFPHKELAPKITSHEGWTQYYHTTPEDILLNPKLYFYFSGIKFATLDVVREMKIKRWEKKDRRDVEMINQFLRQNPPKPLPLRPIDQGFSKLKKWWRSRSKGR